MPTMDTWFFQRTCHDPFRLDLLSKTTQTGHGVKSLANLPKAPARGHVLQTREPWGDWILLKITNILAQSQEQIFTYLLVLPLKTLSSWWASLCFTPTLYFPREGSLKRIQVRSECNTENQVQYKPCPSVTGMCEAEKHLQHMWNYKLGQLKGTN